MTDVSGTTNRAPAMQSSGGKAAFTDLAVDALRYWEPRRLVYNMVLMLVVLGHFVLNWPTWKLLLTTDVTLVFFLLAVLANICYCAAYPVDLLVQFSGVHRAWPKWRLLVLALGTAFAAVLAQNSTTAILATGAD